MAFCVRPLQSTYLISGVSEMGADSAARRVVVGTGHSALSGSKPCSLKGGAPHTRLKSMRHSHAHDRTTLSPPPRPLAHGQLPSRRLDVTPGPTVHAQRPGPLGLFLGEADRGPSTMAP